jgi:hypothetical protein
MRDAQNVAELLVKACKRPTRRRPRSIHGAAIEADILAVADLWLEELTRLQADVDAVRRVGLWLASTSPNRGPVKIGWRCLARQGATKMSTSLFAALEQDQVDRALLTAAGDIVRTDRRACPRHRQLCRRRRDHRALPGPDARSRAESLPDYRAVAAIRDLVGADERWEVDPPGWNVSRREAFHAMCLEIHGQSHRHQRVAALLTPDTADSDFWNARVVARDLGIDTFEVTLRRIGQNSAAARGDRQRSRPRARSWPGVEGP